MPADPTFHLECEQDLIRDIAYALRDVADLSPKRGGRDVREMAARRVVEHLRLSSWVFDRSQPAQIKAHRG